MSAAPHHPAIDEKELGLVDQFRQSRNTSVLTVMFTDIQGFTRLTEEKGDAYSNEVRRTHDSILVPIIEEGGAGRVIKHIGDAVMAVFAEPSAAVARALKIQEALRAHNASHPGDPRLLVRIGLHMGQVTMEDRISLDVFGRHVNRASRVEGLADGGHVFLTYSVFDSAKGYLAGHKGEAAWVSHGKYRVKGIDEPIEIFEAFNPKDVRPKAPQGAKKQSNMPRLAPALGLVLAGALAVLGIMAYKATSVTFEDLAVRNGTDIILDHKTRLQVEGTHQDHLRRCLTKIEPGNHLIYYDVSYVTRYYAALVVKRGRNILRPEFEYFGLPGITGNTGFNKNGKNGATYTNETTYATYDDQGVKHDHQAALSLTMTPAEGTPVPAAPGVPAHHKLFWTMEWCITLDGNKVSADKTIAEHDPTASDSTDGKKDLWGDSRHRYVLKYYLNNTFAQGEIQAQYSEYK